jgi:hypothetical protein
MRSSLAPGPTETFSTHAIQSLELEGHGWCLLWLWSEATSHSSSSPKWRTTAPILCLGLVGCLVHSVALSFHHFSLFSIIPVMNPAGRCSPYNSRVDSCSSWCFHGVESLHHHLDHPFQLYSEYENDLTFYKLSWYSVILSGEGQLQV